MYSFGESVIIVGNMICCGGLHQKTFATSMTYDVNLGGFSCFSRADIQTHISMGEYLSIF